MIYNISTQANAIETLKQLLYLCTTNYSEAVNRIDSIIGVHDYNSNDFTNKLDFAVEDAVIENLVFYCEHFTTNGNNCKSIKENGLITTEKLLIGENELTNFLKRNNIFVDIEKYQIVACGKTYDLKNVKLYENSELERLSHYIYKDNYICTFTFCKDYKEYSVIRNCPELLAVMDNALCGRTSLLQRNWIKETETYKICMEIPIIGVIMKYIVDVSICNDETELKNKTALCLIKNAINVVSGNSMVQFLHLQNDKPFDLKYITAIEKMK